MKTFTIEIELKSGTLIGSGEGFGAIIDTDVIFDETGIPYIPAKRLKGCLRDSAGEVRNMLEKAGVKDFITEEDINNTFGIVGTNSCPVYFSNLFVKDYEANKEWVTYLTGKFGNILSKESIADSFTEIRQQTAIKDGVAKKHSLRTIRVIRKGYKFYGEITVDVTDREKIVNTLALACLNLKNIGTKRNRGYGEIECKLLDNNKEISIIERLEEVCKD